MNRYQFEDLISDYLDNEISLNKRKKFEAYLKNNADAQAKVESVRLIIKKMNHMQNLTTSKKFNSHLMRKIDFENIRDPQKISKTKTLLGFTPLNASMMSALIIGFFLVSIMFFESIGFLSTPENKSFTEFKTPNKLEQKNRGTFFNNDSLDHFAKSRKDSTKYQKMDFSKKMQFVNE